MGDSTLKWPKLPSEDSVPPQPATEPARVDPAPVVPQPVDGAATELEDGDEQASRPRHAWRPSTLGRQFLDASMRTQLLVLGPVGFLLLVGWNMLLPSKRVRSDAKPSDFVTLGAGTTLGADGYPSLQFAQADRLITERDAVALLSRGARRDAAAEGDALPSAPQPMPVTLRQLEDAPSRRRLAPWGRRRAAPALADTAVKPRSVRFYAPGGTLQAAGDQKGPAGQPGLPLGARIHASLDVGVSTQHTGSVLARLTEDLVVADKTVLRAGDLLRGRATGDSASSRMFLTFSEAFASGRSVAFQGYAVLHNEPGVAAKKRETTPQERQRHSVVDSLLESAKDIASDVGEGVGASVMRNVARGSVSQVQEDIQPQPSYVLSLPAGSRFEVIVTG